MNSKQALWETSIEKVRAHTFRFVPCFLFTICMNLYMPVSFGFAGSHSFLGVVAAIGSYVPRFEVPLMGADAGAMSSGPKGLYLVAQWR